jgi:radical SAM superfamily enzyme YgiQ (UPF0313 family)
MGPRLLLINPAMTANTSGTGSRPSREGGYPSAGRRQPNAAGAISMEPLGLAYVAALTPRHWQVRIVDEVAESIPTDYQPDLVGLTSLSITTPRAYEIARWYREQGVPVVMGGVHATLLPDEAQGYVDVVYRGEAEGAWPLLISDWEEGELKPRYEGGAVSLQGLPLPDRDAYSRRYIMQLVSASRGCRYRCEFCTLWKLDGGRYRARPPEQVLAELAETKSRRPILFTDENVITDRAWALELFSKMASNGQQRSHAVQASLDIADDPEMLSALKESGCMTVLIGFESLNEESLRVMRKGVNLKIGIDRFAEKVDKLHDHGLAVSGTFIFGSDGDGPDVFERTVEFVLETSIDLAHFGLLTPHPGTDLYRRLAKEERLFYTDFPADYTRYDLQTAVFRPQKMKPDELEKGLRWATQAVSSRGVAASRAWRTWRSTGNPLMTALAFGWNRSGLYRRVLQHAGNGNSMPVYKTDTKGEPNLDRG